MYPNPSNFIPILIALAIKIFAISIACRKQSQFPQDARLHWQTLMNGILFEFNSTNSWLIGTVLHIEPWEENIRKYIMSGGEMLWRHSQYSLSFSINSVVTSAVALVWFTPTIVRTEKKPQINFSRHKIWFAHKNVCVLSKSSATKLNFDINVWDDNGICNKKHSNRMEKKIIPNSDFVAWEAQIWEQTE